MASKRYTIIVADPTTGVEHRASVPVRPVIAIGCALLTLPVLAGIGAAWKARFDVADALARRDTLEIENANYREATQSLSDQIGELQSTITKLGAKSLEPGLARAVEKLPAPVKARAIGRGPEVNAAARTLSALATPDDTFGLIRTLLEGLESRLNVVSGVLDRRQALADATPSIWPSRGLLTSAMGLRTDPLGSGSDNFHSGLDIAGRRGQAVYATAKGTVRDAGWSGAYGNLIVVNHGFGLESRYGHLLDFTVKAGDHVDRGQIIGHVGATGRATGYHLHYEVHANGALLNPLQLLTQQRPRAQ